MIPYVPSYFATHRHRQCLCTIWKLFRKIIAKIKKNLTIHASRVRRKAKGNQFSYLSIFFYNFSSFFFIQNPTYILLVNKSVILMNIFSQYCVTSRPQRQTYFKHSHIFIYIRTTRNTPSFYQ